MRVTLSQVQSPPCTVTWLGAVHLNMGHTSRVRVSSNTLEHRPIDDLRMVQQRNFAVWIQLFMRYLLSVALTLWPLERLPSADSTVFKCSALTSVIVTAFACVAPSSPRHLCNATSQVCASAPPWTCQNRSCALFRGACAWLLSSIPAGVCLAPPGQYCCLIHGWRFGSHFEHVSSRHNTQHVVFFFYFLPTQARAW